VRRRKRGRGRDGQGDREGGGIERERGAGTRERCGVMETIDQTYGYVHLMVYRVLCASIHVGCLSFYVDWLAKSVS
jgi:hypothetical protein